MMTRPIAGNAGTSSATSTIIILCASWLFHPAPQVLYPTMPTYHSSPLKCQLPETVSPIVTSTVPVQQGVVLHTYLLVPATMAGTNRYVWRRSSRAGIAVWQLCCRNGTVIDILYFGHCSRSCSSSQTAWSLHDRETFRPAILAPQVTQKPHKPSQFRCCPFHREPRVHKLSLRLLRLL